MGELDGESDGVEADGERVGEMEGLEIVGLSVGVTVGVDVVGGVVGEVEGLDPVGLIVGLRDGPVVGDILGLAVAHRSVQKGNESGSDQEGVEHPSN